MANKSWDSPRQDEHTGATSILERRRTSRIVHDERGNARVEWVDAPPEQERTTLSLEQTQPTTCPEHGYNPYARGAGGSGKAPAAPPTAPAADSAGQRPRRDLRKLSEWIKQMRELEARKRDASDD